MVFFNAPGLSWAQTWLAEERRACEDVSTVPFYDFAIADQAFDSMKIIASPRMSAGNRVILEVLRDRYNPNAELLESCIEL